MASIIKSNTYADFNGREILTANNDGALTTQKILYPAFQAELSANQEVTDNTDTKVQFDTEIFDTDNCYDNTTNYRFTPTVAGRYYIYLNLGVNSKANSNLNFSYSYIYKNGSRVALGHGNYNNNPLFMDTLQAFTVIDMNGTTDYIEAYGRGDVGSGGARFDGGDFSVFGAYRIGS